MRQQNRIGPLSSVLRNRWTDAFIIMFAVVVLAGQAIANTDGYPARFQQAAVNSAVESPPVIKAYLELVSELDMDDWREKAEALYAEDVYFSDTFLIAETRAEVIEHFAGLRASGVQLDLHVHDVLQGQQGTYLVWSVNNELPILGGRIHSESIGVTLFAFDDTGRIRLQQDFWDSTQGFYQHLPIIGAIIRSIRGRVAG